MIIVVNNPMNKNQKECISCHILKPLEEFDVRNNGGNITYRNQCKSCRRNIWKDWKLKNLDKIKQNKHDWYIKAKKNGKIQSFREQCRKRKLKFINMLGGKCQNCGYNKCISALDFHHINPEDRSKTKESREYLYKFFEKLVLENKIMLLCCRCHRELHYEDKNDE